MTNPTLERAARAVEKCRIEVRDKRNLELQNMGLWPDHAAQPSNEEIARAVLMAVRDEMVDVAAIKPTVDFARTNRETELVLDYAQQGFTSTINKILVREDS